MILCCGEALIDMIPTPGAGDRPAWAAYPGGAVFNTALALGRLQAPAGLLTGLSSDLFGEMLRAALVEAGVDPSPSIRTERKTTLAFVTLRDGQASYSFHDAGSALRDLRAEDMPALPASVSALFFGGISLVGEPCGDAFESLMLREAPGRVTMLDPNIRPAFVTDEAAYRARLARMIAVADIVKVSHEDLDWLSPGPDDWRDKARALLALGPRIVAVTRGEAGATALTADGQEVTVPARRVQVADTVGAGDTFNAGFLARLHELGALTPDALAGIEAETLRSAMDWGVAAAAIVVGRTGAQPPMRAELADAAAGMR